MKTFVMHLQSATQYERIENVASFVGEDGSGSFGIRSRRQPARSGTRTSWPKWSSGSSSIHQPPGPPLP